MVTMRFQLLPKQMVARTIQPKSNQKMMNEVPTPKLEPLLMLPDDQLFLRDETIQKSTCHTSLVLPTLELSWKAKKMRPKNKHYFAIFNALRSRLYLIKSKTFNGNKWNFVVVCSHNDSNNNCIRWHSHCSLCSSKYSKNYRECVCVYTWCESKSCGSHKLGLQNADLSNNLKATTSTCKRHTFFDMVFLCAVD